MSTLNLDQCYLLDTDNFELGLLYCDLKKVNLAKYFGPVQQVSVFVQALLTHSCGPCGPITTWQKVEGNETRRPLIIPVPADQDMGKTSGVYVRTIRIKPSISYLPQKREDLLRMEDVPEAYLMKNWKIHRHVSIATDILENPVNSSGGLVDSIELAFELLKIVQRRFANRLIIERRTPDCTDIWLISGQFCSLVPDQVQEECGCYLPVKDPLQGSTITDL